MNQTESELSTDVAVILVIIGIIGGAPHVLLVHRTATPEQNKWALPGGKWNKTESLEFSAEKKLVQETGIDTLYLEQLFTTTGLDDENSSVAVAYFALTDFARVRLRAEEEWKPDWFNVNTLPELAFNNNRSYDKQSHALRPNSNTPILHTACCRKSFRFANFKMSMKLLKGKLWTAETFEKKC